MPEKEVLKTDERQRQDYESQSILNKLSRNWNWSVLWPENRKPDFDRGVKAEYERRNCVKEKDTAL